MIIYLIYDMSQLKTGGIYIVIVCYDMSQLKTGGIYIVIVCFSSLAEVKHG